MRAMVVAAFGGPEVLRMQETAKRQPGPHEALVRVHATSVNPVDCSIRRGERAVSLPAILGSDVSGVVEVVGEMVEDFAAGDEVFYMSEIDAGEGSYAEYHLAPAAMLAHKPATLSHEEVAGLPLAAGTAWEALVRRAALRLGETIVVLGEGDVALFATQIAAAAGARVYLGAAGAAMGALGQRLGAFRAVDPSIEDIVRVIRDETTEGVVNVVFDTCRGNSVAELSGLLAARGRLISTVTPAGAASSETLLRNVVHHLVHVEPDRARLDALRTLVDRGQLRPVIDCVLPLWDAATAHRRFEAKCAAGKLILRVVGDG